MKVCLGGTFDRFHVGHEAMLREAVRDAAAVFVGVTDGDLAQRLDRSVAPWDERANAVRAFVASTGFAGELTVSRLTDDAGPAATGDYDAIVVSPETVPGARRINEKREAADLDPLALRVVPHVHGDDRLPVSATRIAAGDIDREGRRRSDVRVAVGSQNPIKVSAVEAEVARLLGCPVAVQGFDVDSGVPEQPKDDEAQRGADARAAAAMEAWPEADYTVGVEAALIQDPAGETWFDVQACTVLDRNGRRTVGWGPAFQYPDWVTERALRGERISDILGPVADDPRIGGTTGASGFLTDGRMDRTELTRVAVLMAFVPRLRPDLYLAGASLASASE